MYIKSKRHKKPRKLINEDIIEKKKEIKKTEINMGNIEDFIKNWVNSTFDLFVVYVSQKCVNIKRWKKEVTKLRDYIIKIN